MGDVSFGLLLLILAIAWFVYEELPGVLTAKHDSKVKLAEQQTEQERLRLERAKLEHPENIPTS